MAGFKACGGIHMLLSLAMLGVAISICVITGTKFWKTWEVYWSGPPITTANGTYAGTYYEGYYYGDHCYLSIPSASVDLCYVNWAISAVGAVIAALVFAFAICAAASAGPGAACVLLGMFLCLAIFSAQAGLNQKYIPGANDWYSSLAAALGNGADDHNYWRNVILGLSWAAFGISVLALLAALIDLMAAKKAPKGGPGQFVQNGAGVGGAAAAAPGAQPGAFPPAPAQAEDKVPTYA